MGKNEIPSILSESLTTRFQTYRKTKDSFKIIKAKLLIAIYEKRQKLHNK